MNAATAHNDAIDSGDQQCRKTKRGSEKKKRQLLNGVKADSGTPLTLPRGHQPFQVWFVEVYGYEDQLYDVTMLRTGLVQF